MKILKKILLKCIGCIRLSVSKTNGSHQPVISSFSQCYLSIFLKMYNCITAFPYYIYYFLLAFSFDSNTCVVVLPSVIFTKLKKGGLFQESNIANIY